MLSLQLGCEDVSISSDLRLVDWALVHALLFLALLHQDWAAQDNWNHAELLLRFALFEAGICIPSSSFNLQTKDECSFALLQVSCLPIHLLLNVSLDVKPVEFERLLA